MAIKLPKIRTLRSKVLLISILIVGLIIIISTVNYLLLNRLEYYSDLTLKLENLSKKTKELRLVERDILLDSYLGEEFYSTNNSIYAEKFRKSFDELNALYKDIDSEGTSIKNNTINKLMLSMSSDLEIYSIYFNELLDLLKARGYNDYGTIGTLAKTNSELQTYITDNFSDPILLSNTSTLWTYISNYISKRDIKFYENFNIKINVIRNYLRNTYKTNTDSVSIASLSKEQAILVGMYEVLEKTQKNFDELIDLDKNIGLSLEEGKIKELRQIFDRIEHGTIDIESYLLAYNEKASERVQIAMIVFNLLIILLVLFVLIKVERNFTVPFNLFKHHILKLGKGELPEKITLDFNDERHEMLMAINDLTINLDNTRNFVTEVGKGNFNTEVNVFNNTGELGSALVKMKVELQKIAFERSKQESEDKKRNWITQGIAFFNDILRQNSNNIEELAYKVIKSLVDHLDAAQAALYVINDNNKKDLFIELKAAFAFDRRKYITKRIEMGEGLAGRCVLERETIYLEEIPKDYFEISSGLGKAKPTALLLAPLKINDEIYGAIEIASMHKFEDHHKEFAIKVSEAVASAISSVKISLQTANLLRETKIQAEELAAKEEEMRQNMEELQSTQEEAARKEAEASGFVNSVNHSIIRADFTTAGRLEYANTKFLDLMGYTSKEIKGAHVSTFVVESDWAEFEEEWKRIVAGGRHIEREMRYRTKTGHRWFLATYTPIRNIEGGVQRILYLAIDIEEQKSKNLDYKGEITALDRSVIKAEFNTEGILLSANDMFAGNLDYSRKDIEGKEIFAFISNDELERFQKSWRRIAKGLPYEGTIKHVTKSKDDVWFRGTFTSVKDIDGNITKIVYIAYDITTQKRNEDDNKLLLDKANKLADELSSQEEELRQNLDEMRSVQDEMSRKDAIMSSQMEAINRTAAMIELELDGTIVNVNDIFCELFGYVSTDIEGMNHRILIDPIYRKSDKYSEFWESLRKGKVHEGVFKFIRRDSKPIFMKGTYAPVLDDDDNTVKILTLFFDITESKVQEAEIAGQLEAINKTNALIEFDLEGVIYRVNNIFCNLFEYTDTELVGRHHRLLVPIEDKQNDDYKDFWINLRNGHSVNGEFKLVTAKGNLRYLYATYFPINDVDGNPYKIIMLAFDVTQTTEQKDLLLKQKNELELQRVEMQQKVEALNDAMLISNHKERQLNELAEELRASEEELRQNLEELQATQEEMERKNIELEKSSEKMELNEQILKKALEKAKKQALETQEAHSNIITVEEELRQHVEELMATREELERVKFEEKERADKQIEERTKYMQKAVNQFKDKINILNEQIKAKDKEIEMLKDQIK